jgi:hypothetical protein
MIQDFSVGLERECVERGARLCGELPIQEFSIAPGFSAATKKMSTIILYSVATGWPLKIMGYFRRSMHSHRI